VTHLNPRYGQVAYEAYRTQTEGRSLVSGAELPPWDGLSAQIQEAWTVAAAAVLGGAIPTPVRVSER
jgi:hypothetical protein